MRSSKSIKTSITEEAQRPLLKMYGIAIVIVPKRSFPMQRRSTEQLVLDALASTTEVNLNDGVHSYSFKSYLLWNDDAFLPWLIRCDQIKLFSESSQEEMGKAKIVSSSSVLHGGISTSSMSTVKKVQLKIRTWINPSYIRVEHFKRVNVKKENAGVSCTMHVKVSGKRKKDHKITNDEISLAISEKLYTKVT